jgi:CubicO group peptidase (beta-lactamase class C family)
MSKAALDRLENHLKQRYVDAGRFPGTQLLIYRRGKVVHSTAQGFADLERKVPVKDDTIFRIYSMTKPLTSVAFMMLVEEGRVALDEPVHKYIPEWKNLGVFMAGTYPAFLTRPPTRPMLIVDLLRHTSGLTYGFQDRTPIDAAYRESKMESWHGNLTLDEFVAALGKLPLEFSPGEEWNYSVSTDVLGAVVQRLSGQTLDRFFAERILEPLGMHDTFFQVPEDKIDRLADCWTLAPGGARVMYDRGAASAWSRFPRLVSGGGGLVSSALDYHRFNTFFLSGGELGGTRLVSRKTVDLMTMNHLPGGSDLTHMSRSLFSETTNAGTGFGLGFAITMDVAKSMLPGSSGEYYWGGMFSTAFFIDPVERITMVFMTQFSPSTTYPIRRELKTLIYSALT